MNICYILPSLILIGFICIECSFSCPNICSCKWKHGKQTAECDSKGLSVVPEGLNAGTQVIHLSRNNFKEISSKAFQKKGLANLQKIYMSECEITQIAFDAFFQLSNLVELDLSRNKLSMIPTHALSLVSNLRRLQLAHNPITTIENDAFSSLSHLTYLGLSNCHINQIQPGALNGLGSLDVLELDGNRIKTLSSDIFQSVMQLFGLHLHNNPWHCDCKVREIRTWMTEHNIPLSVPPYCESPEYLKGFTWDILSLDDFACIPQVLNVPKVIEVIAGHNASISCKVSSIPKALVYWEVAGKSLKNISISTELKMKYNLEEELSPSHQTSVLTIYNALESDSDVYSCVSENKAGITSANFTLTVLCPNHMAGSWNNFQITLLLFGILFVILLSVAIICLLVYHPVSFSVAFKLNRKNDHQCTPTQKKDTVEMNDVREDKDHKVIDKQPRHETGSSGYGSDQLTPDLVSKIPDMTNGPSLSLSTLNCNHLDSDNPNLLSGYGSSIDNWPHEKNNTLKYDGSSVVRNNVYSEIYLNPCYGKDDDACNYTLQTAGVHQLPNYAVGDRYIPQNDRVQTLRNVHDYDSNREEPCVSPTHDDGYRRYPVVITNTTGHYTLPPKSNFPIDEGYAEEGLEGTEV